MSCNINYRRIILCQSQKISMYLLNDVGHNFRPLEIHALIILQVYVVTKSGVPSIFIVLKLLPSKICNEENIIHINKF